MSVLKKIQAGGDKVSAALNRKGLREYTIDLFTPVPNDPVLGDDGTGTPTLVRLTPPAQVDTLGFSSRRGLDDKFVPGGTLEVGDILVTYISRNAAFTALVINDQTIWRIAGPDINGDFSLKGGSLKRENAYWSALLRKIQ